MKLGTLKAIYFATICLPPPLLLVLYPVVFIWRIRLPAALITYYPIYFWLGLGLLIVDLWRSNRPKNVKVRWSILNTILGVVCLPIYWFRYVLGCMGDQAKLTWGGQDQAKLTWGGQAGAEVPT